MIKTPSPQPLSHGRFDRNGAFIGRGAKDKRLAASFFMAKAKPPLALCRERGLGGEGGWLL